MAVGWRCDACEKFVETDRDADNYRQGADHFCSLPSEPSKIDSEFFDLCDNCAHTIREKIESMG